jgi:hypothetical protein
VERHLCALDAEGGGGQGLLHTDDHHHQHQYLGQDSQDKATRSHWLLAVMLTLQAVREA